MPRTALAFHTPDLSAFARALGRSLAARHSAKPQPPGHVEMLNLIAKAAGHRNAQALRAATLAMRLSISTWPGGCGLMLWRAASERPRALAKAERSGV